MSTLDIIILVCFIPGIVRGIQKGFISQVVSLLSIILGVWLAFHFSEIVCDWLKSYLPALSATVLNVVAFVLILIFVALLLHLAGKLLQGIFKKVDLGWLNWLLGLIFSLLRAAIVIGMVIVLFDTLNLKFEFVSAEKIDSSVLYAPLRDAAYKVFPYLKALLFK